MTQEELAVIEKSKRDLRKSLVSIGLTPEFPEDINASNMTVDPRPFFDDYFIVMFEGRHKERIYTYTELYISPMGEFGEQLGSEAAKRDVRDARADNPDSCADCTACIRLHGEFSKGRPRSSLELVTLMRNVEYADDI